MQFKNTGLTLALLALVVIVSISLSGDLKIDRPIDEPGSPSAEKVGTTGVHATRGQGGVESLAVERDERVSALQAESSNEQDSQPQSNNQQLGIIQIEWELPSDEIATILAGPVSNRKLEFAGTHTITTDHSSQGTSSMEVVPGTWGVWLESDNFLSVSPRYRCKSGREHEYILEWVSCGTVVRSDRRPIEFASARGRNDCIELVVCDYKRHERT